jgi:hypothetical protein
MCISQQLEESILAMIAARPGITCSEIGKAMGRSSYWIHLAVAKLRENKTVVLGEFDIERGYGIYQVGE